PCSGADKDKEVGCVELTGDADAATRNSTAFLNQGGASPMHMSASPRDIAARIRSEIRSSPWDWILAATRSDAKIVFFTLITGWVPLSARFVPSRAAVLVANTSPD